MPKQEFRVDIFSEKDEGGGVYITDCHGEIVCWTTDEMRETPEEVAFAIAGALKILYESGPAQLRDEIAHPGERTGADYRRAGDKVISLRDLYSRDLFPVKTSDGSDWYGIHPQYNKLHVRSGDKGNVIGLRVGHFTVSFPSRNDGIDTVVVTKSFDWGDEGDLFVFEGKAGYGDAPNPPEKETLLNG